MQSLLDRVSGRERLRLLCALGFWLATYLLFVAWNQLQSEFPTMLWQTRRMLTTLVGAILFFGFTRLADRIATRSLRARIGILLAAAIACYLIMVASRALVDVLIVPATGEVQSTWERHLRFMLIWGGYFAGGALAFLSFAPLPRPAVEEADPAIPPAANGNVYPDALWVSRGRETVRVPIEAIDWIEAEGDYVRLHARTGGGLMRGTLTSLEEKLDSQVFARVHRSAICRRTAIVAMLRKPSGAIAARLDTGAEVPIGRRYRESVATLLGPAKDGSGRLTA
jgi:DNA-binding LytR/AlgR family response regulator